MESLKQKVYSVLMDPKSGGGLKKSINLALVALIIANIGAVVIETVEPVYIQHKPIFELFEIFSVSVFCVEYLARLWVCIIDERFAAPVTGRIRYAMTPLAIVDFLAIMPFFLSSFLPLDLRMLRVLRLFRLLRLMKLAKYSESIALVFNIFRDKKTDLIIAVSIVLVLLLLSSSALYFIETLAQPEAFSSIPAAMWWGVATLTTVGYGDVYPITALGKLVGAVVAILGVGMFALPAGILASGFNEYLENKKNSTSTHCPNCGVELSKE